MNEMKGRHLTFLLSQDEEDGVKKLDKLGEVEDPSDVNHTKCIRRVTLVNRLTFDVILTKPTVDSEEPKQVSIQYHHRKVVDDHRKTEIIRFAMLHHIWTNDFDEEKVCQTH